MTPEEFKTTIHELGYSQVAISRLFGVNDRTGRRWALGEVPIPEAVSTCLALMMLSGLTPEVMAFIIAKRVGNEFGQQDEVQFRWILPKFDGAEWVVAKFYRSKGVFFIPESAAEIKLGEVHLGPRVYPPSSATDIAS
ncbi:hypothetical protein RE411_03440 [Agrobacterium pusense]|uniref:helix-turn-helix domain-containing protein n=1 Tax=Agrobacterium pusense TaxID=648995 RepID=UPI002867B79E|nr:hypothetical protein [Agrobacterium pusense]WMW56247.1 hypothetical protein RE411_03440 [Agrobacterium pusense]